MANLPPTSALGPPSTKRPRIELDLGEEVQLLRFWVNVRSIYLGGVSSIGRGGYRISKKREPKGFGIN